MANLLLAMQLAKKLNGSHIKVLEWFVQHGEFEGSYRELANEIYGKSTVASNLRKYVVELQDMGILMVAVNDDCPNNDTNRTFISLNSEWKNKI